MDLSWIRAFGGDVPLDQERVDALLDLAAYAAHDSDDRRNAPLACFLRGLELGRSGAEPTADRLKEIPS